MDNKLFIKYICAVCNEGGGVILLGTNHKHNELYAKGIKFKAIE
jgi:predicted HTH transcriptional regulator